MKIWELIKQLEKFNQDDEIRVPCASTGDPDEFSVTDRLMLKPLKDARCPNQNPRHLLIAPREGPWAEKDFQLIFDEERKEEANGEES